MRKLVSVVLFLVVICELAYSQSGIRFPELSRRLENYFNKEMIQDLQREFPQGSDYTIWGWDVGDFSGDGVPDAAFSVRISGQRGRIMQVYLFVDIDGYFVKAGQFAYEFVELPLEIGVVIRDNACYVTQKHKQFNWLIRGYRFDNGALIMLDEFTTERIGEYTYESYKNYQNLQNTEKFIVTNTGKTRLFAEYTTIPSYRRGRQIYKGYSSEVKIDNINFVPKGAFWWGGGEDLSFSVSSAWDETYLYMTVKVKDDKIVPQNCDTCICDYVEVWFDVNTDGSNRFADLKGNKVTFKENIEGGIFNIKIYPGNFLDRTASVKVSTTDELEPYQKIAAHDIMAISDIQDTMYLVRFRVPFAFLGIQGNPVEAGKLIEFGCTVSVHDYDNEFRPEEYTRKNSSVFDPQNPATYGSIVLVPDDMWYGSSKNIFLEDILKTLVEYGF
ncbi:MAG TPA: sugar-binding protein [Candidatus Kapabacteria bacterium]|nr:sugar-binding protein [Candidatus Kapabacteria bacterium]HOM04736.1 sugar-binding protein [Candidatus Kapabacteria bacterium]HPP40409.1 sugar-binding protein [Candidatus Kapabacteria bacterium]HPU23797.1 sugar-binding protein [Candidatus Kapabacteria bacterium]